jgi:adenosine kinase
MNILLTGSVAFDYLMSFPGYFRDHFLLDKIESISLSFLVDSMYKMQGGVAPNIAYTMAMLGERPHLWAAVGEDFEDYRRFLDNKGVDTSGAKVIPGVFTASFFVNTDKANAQIASFYPGAMGYASQLSLRSLSANPPDLTVISPNDPVAMNQYVFECQELGVPYAYDPSQQIVRLTADDLQRGLEGALALFVNDYEFALIDKMTGLDASCVLDNHPDAFVVVTEGEKGAQVHTNSGTLRVPCVSPERILDPTGVGDAFRGGFLTGYSRNLDMEICGRMGALAATYCLEYQGSQGQSYSIKEFIERYQQVFGENSDLDCMLQSKF